MQYAGQQLVAGRPGDSSATGGGGAAGGQVERALDRAGIRVGLAEIKPHIPLRATQRRVLRHAVVVVGAGQQQVAAVGQLRAHRQAFPFFRRFAAQRGQGVGVQIQHLGRFADWRVNRASGVQIHRADIAGAGQIDAKHLLVGGGKGGAHAHAPVVALQHIKRMVVDGHQRRDALALARPLHRVGVLRHRLAGAGVELELRGTRLAGVV